MNIINKLPLFAALAFALVACDAEPVDLDAPASYELAPEQIEQLELALEAHAAAPAGTPLPQLDIEPQETEPGENESSPCDPARIAEYCNTLDPYASYPGQCISDQYALLPGFCILVGSEFAWCEYQGYACSTL